MGARGVRRSAVLTHRREARQLGGGPARGDNIGPVARRKTTRGGAGEDGPTFLAPGWPRAAAVEAALEDRIVKGRQLLGQIDIHVFPQPEVNVVM